MKNIRRLSLVIIAGFVFAMGVFAAPPAVKDGQPSVSATKARTAVVITNIDAVDLQQVAEVEQVVELNGRSTYALSRCPATFTPIANTIDRFPPLLQPPNS